MQKRHCTPLYISLVDVKGKVQVVQWNNGVVHCRVDKMLHKLVHLDLEEANAEKSELL